MKTPNTADQDNAPTPPDAPQEVRGELIYYPTVTILTIPYDAQSRERIVDQMAREIRNDYLLADTWDTASEASKRAFRKTARAALTAIEPKENK